MRRVVQLLKWIFVGLLILVPFGTKANGYYDVNAFYKHSEAINQLTDQGVISGYSDGSYRPENQINRAEFLKVVVEAVFSPAEINNCLNQYTQSNWSYTFYPDVPAGVWYAKYICTATVHQIINGYPDGTFKPANPINFAESLKVILNTYRIDTSRVRFVKNPLLLTQSNDWFVGYFSYAFNKELINTKKFYHPAQIMRRGEMAEVIYRLNSLQHTNESRFSPTSTAYSDEYTITIPTLNIIELKVTVADPYNANNALDVLKDGLGHYLFNPGAGHKFVIFGHSSGYSWDTSQYKQVLRQINQLRAGDRIYINYQERGFVYEVRSSDVMPAQALPSIMEDDGYEQLAMYTCWPPNSISKRYVIYADPVSTMNNG